MEKKTMNIEKKVIEIVRNVSEGLPMSNYENVNLFDSNILDSLLVMQLVSELCDAFEIEIDVDDVIAENFDTVTHIIELVRMYMK